MGTSGGAAAPRSLLRAFQDRYGLRIIQGWGMTETSPVGGMAHPPAGVGPGTEEELDWRTKSGRVTGRASRCGSLTTTGQELPWDGGPVGEIEVRGPWITGSYYRDPAAGQIPRRLAADRRHRHHRRPGLLPDHRPRQGRHQVRRRVDLLGRAGEPARRAARGVLEAAVIGIPDEKWTERPLACVVVKDEADPARLASYLDGKVARWQIPENWTFITEIPKTTVGKFDKKLLRARYRSGDLDVKRTRD